MSVQVKRYVSHPVSRPANADVSEPVIHSDPKVVSIVELSEQLAELMTQVEISEENSHPRECLPVNVKEMIINWLGGVDLVKLM